MVRKSAAEWCVKCGMPMHTRGSLVAKNRRSILVAMFTICLARFSQYSDVRNGWTPPRPTRRHFFDPCPRQSCSEHTMMPRIYPIMATPTSTRLYSRCRRRQHASCCCSHYTWLVLYRGVLCVVWVNITSTRNPKLS